MYEVNAQVLQATIKYLETQPYANVAMLIQALSQSRQIAPASPQPMVEEKKEEK